VARRYLHDKDIAARRLVGPKLPPICFNLSTFNSFLLLRKLTTLNCHTVMNTDTTLRRCVQDYMLPLQESVLKRQRARQSEREWNMALHVAAMNDSRGVRNPVQRLPCAVSRFPWFRFAQKGRKKGGHMLFANSSMAR